MAKSKATAITDAALDAFIEQTEGAGVWLRVMTELKSRGVDDILVALVDGLVGFPEAITTVFPQAQVHHGVVHLVRQSLAYASWKDRKGISGALRAIYRAPTEAAAVAALEECAAGPWGLRYPAIVALWQRHWPSVRPVFAYPPDIRRLLYTTNAIESLHMQLRKIIKSRGHFPTDEAATKLLYLALRNILAKWNRGNHAWQAAMPHLALLFGARFTDHAGPTLTASHTKARTGPKTVAPQHLTLRAPDTTRTGGCARDQNAPSSPAP